MRTHDPAYEYVCGYCGKGFLPTRRRVQKYCSASCRSQAHKLRKAGRSKKLQPKPGAVVAEEAEVVEVVQEPQQLAPVRGDKVTGAGIAESALGHLAAQGLVRGAKAAFGIQSKSERALEEVRQKVAALHRDAAPRNLISRTGVRIALAVGWRGRLTFDEVIHQPTQTRLYHHLDVGYVYYDEVERSYKPLPFDPVELSQK